MVALDHDGLRNCCGAIVRQEGRGGVHVHGLVVLRFPRVRHPAGSDSSLGPRVVPLNLIYGRALRERENLGQEWIVEMSVSGRGTYATMLAATYPPHGLGSRLRTLSHSPPMHPATLSLEAAAHSRGLGDSRLRRCLSPGWARPTRAASSRLTTCSATWSLLGATPPAMLARTSSTRGWSPPSRWGGERGDGDDDGNSPVVWEGERVTVKASSWARRIRRFGGRRSMRSDSISALSSTLPAANKGVSRDEIKVMVRVIGADEGLCGATDLRIAPDTTSV